MWQTAFLNRGSRGYHLVQRFAVFGLSALLAGTFATMGAPREAHAGGRADALAVHVTGSPLGGITSSPISISPNFAPNITDYVWRCQSGINTIQLNLAAISGGTI